MVSDLKNKIVVVTGGAQGIGFSIVEKFTKESAKVIIVDIHEDNGKEAVEKLNNEAVFMKCDVRTESENIFNEIIEKYKRVDVLVNNAGVGDEDFQNAIDINLTACVKLSLKFYEDMSNNSGGTIINISSIIGYRAEPFMPVYQATKAGVIALTRSLGHKKNYEKSGVKVIALCPGYTRSNLTKPILEEHSSVPDYMVEHSKCHTWQDTDSVGNAAVKAFKEALSASIWVIEGGKLEEVHLQYQHS